MIQVAILDDDEKDGIKNEELLRRYFDKRRIEARIDRFFSGDELLENKKIYHMLFLDIEVGEENGIQIAGKLRDRLPDILIVVITSYVRYSLDGYKIQASRYLLKPIHEELLYNELDELLKTKDTSDTITLTTRDETTLVKLNNILYFESEGRRTKFHTAALCYKSHEAVSFWAQQLSTHFIECHKGIFVQLAHIRQLGKDKVYISNHEELPLARRRSQQVEEAWLRFQEMSL